MKEMITKIIVSLLVYSIVFAGLKIISYGIGSENTMLLVLAVILVNLNSWNQVRV